MTVLPPSSGPRTLLKWHAQLVIEHPRWVGLLLAAVLLWAAVQLPSLTFDFTPQSLFDTESEHAKAYTAFLEEHPPDDQLCFIVLEGQLQDAEIWQVLGELERCLRGADACVDGRAGPEHLVETHSVLSTKVAGRDDFGALVAKPLVQTVPGDGPAAKRLAERALANPLLVNNLIGAQGQQDPGVGALGLVMRIDSEVQAIDDVLPITRRTREIVRATRARYPKLRVHFGGPPLYRTEVIELMVRDMMVFTPLGALALLLVMAWLFRTIAGTLLPLVSCLLGMFLTLALMASRGQALDILGTVLPTLLLVIGAADAIHLIVRQGHELQGGDPPKLALRRTLLAIGTACFLTSFTTSVGFGSLFTAHIEPLRVLGFYSGVGVMLTYAATLTFLPWSLRTVRRPTRTLGRSTALDRNLASLGLWSASRPWITLTILALAGLFIAGGLPRLVVDNFIMQYLDEDSEAAKANAAIERSMAGVVGLEILLEAPDDDAWLSPDLLQRAHDFETALLRQGYLGQRSSPALLLSMGLQALRDLPSPRLPSSRREASMVRTVLSSSTRQLDDLLSVDGRQYRISGRIADIGAIAYRARLAHIERLLEESFRGTSTQWTITGATDLGYRGIDQLMRDLMRSLAWASAVIFLVLVLLFRSLRWAAVAMIPNLLPVMLVIAGLGWWGWSLETTSAMTFCIGLGIAVDDTIHFLGRYREALGTGQSTEEAIRTTLSTTGRALVFTTVLLVFGFGLLGASFFPPNRRFALLSVILLVLALGADLVLLPALVKMTRLRLPGQTSDAPSPSEAP